MVENHFNTSVLPAPLPQVGAVLHLDTRLPQEDLLAGNRHWKLSGSCVLAEADRILTIRHILDRTGRTAVFFPFEGLFDMQKEAAELEENRTHGDNLALLRLARPVSCAAPLRHLKIDSFLKYQGYATVCGYGRWPGAPLNGVDGLQRRFKVHLGLPPRNGRPGWIHYDNLDLMWASSRNEDLAAGRGNSGGPMLWGNDGEFRYVGINRERKLDGRYDLQLGSWIGWDRKKWLDSSVERPAAPRPCLGRETRAVVVKRTGPTLVQVNPPEGARRLRCTLNAGEGLRLQMGVTAGPPDADFLESLAHDNHASGRFLYRETEVPLEARQLSIGIAAVARAPFRAERTVAQVCCLFL